MLLGGNGLLDGGRFGNNLLDGGLLIAALQSAELPDDHTDCKQVANADDGNTGWNACIANDVLRLGDEAQSVQCCQKADGGGMEQSCRASCEHCEELEQERRQKINFPGAHFACI